MDFFNSLTLDLKLLAVGIAGCALLALFSGNKKAEKRYMLVFAVLAAAGVYRFNQVTSEGPEARGVITRTSPAPAREQPQRKAIESTYAK